MVFAEYSGFLHYLQLASHELATIGISVTKNEIPNPNYHLRVKTQTSGYCMYSTDREDTNHIIMQCPNNEGIKSEMFDMIFAIDDEIVQNVMNESDDVFSIIMGKHPVETPFDSMLKIWLVSSKYITSIYRTITKER